MKKLDGKVAIITGGSGGIGAATAKRFIEEGAKVLLVDLKEGPLEEVAAELGASAAICAADVSRPEDAERYVKEAAQRFGGVDVVFANAGIEGKVASLVDATPEDFERVLAVNVRGAWLSIKYGVPEMIRRGKGSIVITSSIAGLIGSPGLGPYVTSKHAVIGLSRSAALELAPHNIRVNTVHPGPIENRMMRSIEEQASPGDPAAVKSGFLNQVPLKRYGTNEEIAAMVTFLASDESSYSTGGIFVADGGFVVG
jgi:3alpha(or 20beta)-hydroxysteroid dehydrogenase